MKTHVFSFSGAVLLALLLISPVTTYATQEEADAMCDPVKPECPCGQVMMPLPGGGQACQMIGPQANKFMCPGICFDVTNGHKTTGTCIAPHKCKATQTAEGGSPGLGQVGDIMKGIMPLLQKLMQGGGGGGGQGQSGSGTGSSLGSSWNPNTCYGTLYTSSIPTTDPCAIYQPQTSDSLLNSLNSSQNTSSTLLDALNGGSSDTSVHDASIQDTTPQSVGSLLQSGAQDGSSASRAASDNAAVGGAAPAGGSSTQTGTGAATAPGASVAGLVPLSGARGDITTDTGGLTVVAGTRDEQTNTEIAGFYGADTGAQSSTIAGSWCASRPWATNFLGKIISPSFFDGICERLGYAVGELPAPVAVTPRVQLNQQPTSATPKSKLASPTEQLVEPKVQIWAVPAKVSLGTRTSVFWNTQGVASCTETSPDGSFSQTSLSGGASTVPLTGPTTFTISCLDMGGNPVTGEVTVEIKI